MTDAYQIEALEKKLRELTCWTIDFVREQRERDDALRAERDRLRSELKNFLAAFDAYFDMRGGMPGAERVMDAQQAMFSAAMQARTALTENGAKDE